MNHDIGIPDFGISETLNPGQTTTIEFLADKSGIFNFFFARFIAELVAPE